MALTLTCDGCACPLPIDTKSVGHLEPVFYCSTCRATWETHVVAEDHARADLITRFEAWRATALDGMRKQLGKLPDE